MPNNRETEEVDSMLQLLEGPDDAGLGGGTAGLLPAEGGSRTFSDPNQNLLEF
jgi:hypothetical protein